MKKIYLFIAVVALICITAACGNSQNTDMNNREQDQDQDQDQDYSEEEKRNTNKEIESSVNDNGQNIEATAQEDMKTKMDRLNYTSFELEVDYPNKEEYEVELELENRGQTVDAELEDSINNVYKKGEEAFNELYPKVEMLTIGQSTSKEDAIQEVLKVFNLASDYREIEIEIKFKDGTKIEFEDKK